MTICYGCGEHLEFRHIEGRVVPLGCRCYSGGEWSPSRWRDPGSVFGGFRVLGTPLTYRTFCWWCGAEVFFHTNGNGDCVLFDPPLGPPWPVHDCWQLHRDDSPGTYWRRMAVHLSVGVEPQSHDPVQVVSEVLRALRTDIEHAIIPLTDLDTRLPTPHPAAPIRPDAERPGPWLFVQWVSDRFNSGGRHFRLVGAVGPWETLTLTNGVEFVVAGQACGKVRVGDLIVVRVEVHADRRAAVYVATYLARIDGTKAVCVLAHPRDAA